MAYLKYIPIVCLFAGLLACNSNKQPQGHAQTSLAGTVYLFAPEFDSTTGAATGACDCCSGNAVFLTDSTFVMIDYCEADYSYTKGKYYITGDELQMDFDTIAVQKNNTYADEEKPDSPAVYTFITQRISYATNIYKIKRFKGKPTFAGENEYGCIDTGINKQGIIAEMKEENTWQKLGLQ